MVDLTRTSVDARLKIPSTESTGILAWQVKASKREQVVCLSEGVQ